jgi:hypothetical protein
LILRDDGFGMYKVDFKRSILPEKISDLKVILRPCLGV